MIGKVLFAVDGSVPAHEAAERAHGLLPKATEVLILEVVPQLPYGWVPWPWPAFPDLAADLAKASAHVSEVGRELEARGWNIRTKVQCSVLSAAEMDQEILRLAEILEPDLIGLALEWESVTARLVREAAVPVLVTKPSSRGTDTRGRRVRSQEYLRPALAHSPSC